MGTGLQPEAARAVLTPPAPFDVVARRIFELCRAIIGAESGYVALLSVDGGTSEPLFVEPGSGCCRVDRGLEMPVRGLRAEAYRTGLPVIENDVASSASAALLPPGHVALANVLFAPITTGDDAVVGLIGLANKPGGFTAADADTATALADIAALALDHQRLDSALQASRKELTQTLDQLEAKSVAVRELVDVAAGERRRLEASVHRTVQSVVMPLLQQLHGAVDPLRVPLLLALEKALNELSRSFGDPLKTLRDRLTARELQVCELIRQGLATRDVADGLGLSERGVETHRRNIRRKLHLTGSSQNLEVFLRGL